MFTLDQIQNASKKVKSGADFPQLVHDLKTIGVTHYETFVEDGRTRYHGISHFKLDTNAKYAVLTIHENGSAARLKDSIRIHQKGQTDFLTFCKEAAEAGVEKWTTHMFDMEVTYFDKAGNKLLVEPIPEP